MTHSTTTRRAGAGAVALTTAATLLCAPTALADDADVVERGSCSGSTDWKVGAGPDDGRIEVEGEVDSNRSGQSWRWRIVHNGSVSFRGTKETAGASGSFEVRRRLVDADGDDTVVWRARNRASDDVCRGKLTY